ncbi:MAG TPA: phasin family protein [Sphingomicrobium sp.]|nr:phasin family protein [Sphingomicrobium sp.]
MADEIKSAIDATAEAATSAVEGAGEAAKQSAATTEKSAKRATASAKPVSKRTARTAEAATTKAARRSKPRRSTRKPAAPRKAAAVNERINDVNSNINWFAPFGALPTAAPLQDLFAQAGERSQEAVKRSQKAVEELADLGRANVEALVDAGKIAVEGARALGQDVVDSSREGVEKAADAVRALAEAKSPTEFIQLQSEFARAQFDRFVAESSRLTESAVKLAGEAIRPLQSRATLNAERINQFVA